MYKKRPLKSLMSAALAGVALTAGWSGSAHACAVEPYLTSVCVMGWANGVNFGNTYVPAAGQLMLISQYSAVFALLGNTYGGDARTNFMLPNLQGRFIMGSNRNAGVTAGQTGGASSVTLSAQQLPQHTHGATNLRVTWNQGTLGASTTLSGLTATTSLTGVTASVKGSDLTLNAGVGVSSDQNTPSGTATLGTTAPALKIYASNPLTTTALHNKSIGGTAAVTFSGNPTTTVSGNPITTLTGAPMLGLSGSIDPAGASTPVNILPPYLVMNYYIAVNGAFPSQD